LLAQKVKSEAGRKLQQRFRRHRDKLLMFLQDPAIPPANNESEQALRSSIIHRKATNGFRSEWGARAYAALQSITATAKQKGQQVFAYPFCRPDRRQVMMFRLSSKDTLFSSYRRFSTSTTLDSISRW
jgi:transposase